MLRRIEASIEAIDNPQTCGADFSGSQRTISPTAKTRELMNLTQKLSECQKLVTNDNEQEWLNGVKETLKARVNLVFNPPVTGISYV
jgi:hypothetical protein